MGDYFRHVVVLHQPPGIRAKSFGFEVVFDVGVATCGDLVQVLARLRLTVAAPPMRCVANGQRPHGMIKPT
jgi:hypothetical protein